MCLNFEVPGTKNRSFLAIELTSIVQNQLKSFLIKLEKLALRDIRYVPLKNLHLTLRFLGEITTEQETQLISALDEQIKKLKSFEMQIYSQLLFFSNEKNARMMALKIMPYDSWFLWLKILDPIIQSIGLTIENKPFIPHLTIARFKQSPDQRFMQKITQIINTDKIIADMRVKELTLFHSDLQPSQTIYRVVKRFPVS